MRLTRRLLLGAAAATPLHRLRAAGAEPIRIGVLTDLSGAYRDVIGPTSVICVRQAVAEFIAANPGIAVEVLAADHQNKPDVAVGIAREWFDRGGVGAITGVVAMGLPASQGLVLTETFYWDWDLNDRTRSFYARARPSLPEGVFPNNVHAGAYAGTLHYLKTVRAMGVTAAKASGRASVAAMKAMPTDDDCFGPGLIRADGCKIHPAYLLQAKAPAQSRYPGDVFNLLATTPADQAFRPISEGGCKLLPA